MLFPICSQKKNSNLLDFRSLKLGLFNFYIYFIKQKKLIK